MQMFLCPSPSTSVNCVPVRSLSWTHRCSPLIFFLIPLSSRSWPSLKEAGLISQKVSLVLFFFFKLYILCTVDLFLYLLFFFTLRRQDNVSIGNGEWVKSTYRFCPLVLSCMRKLEGCACLKRLHPMVSHRMLGVRALRGQYDQSLSGKTRCQNRTHLDWQWDKQVSWEVISYLGKRRVFQLGAFISWNVFWGERSNKGELDYIILTYVPLEHVLLLCSLFFLKHIQLLGYPIFI